MAEFLKAVQKTLKHEGRLANLRGDAGGLTNFGISIAAHPRLSESDIRNMTQAQAIEIYHEEYWLPIYDRISDQLLADQLFDFGVTSSPHLAINTLQGAIFVGGGKALDGFFGEKTLQAANAGGVLLLVNFVTERLRFYAGRNKPEFLHSWIERTIEGLLT